MFTNTWSVPCVLQALQPRPQTCPPKLFIMITEGKRWRLASLEDAQDFMDSRRQHGSRGRISPNTFSNGGFTPTLLLLTISHGCRSAKLNWLTHWLTALNCTKVLTVLYLSFLYNGYIHLCLDCSSIMFCYTSESDSSPVVFNKYPGIFNKYVWHQDGLLSLAFLLKADEDSLMF